MTDDTDTTVDIDDTNLDDFEKTFFNPEPKAEEVDEEVVEEAAEEEVEEKVDETEDDSLATDDEDEDEAEEEDEDEDEEEIVEVPQLKKRNRAQERIEQLLERERLANDRAHALELRLAKLEAEKTEVVKEEGPNVRDQLPVDAPSPDAKDKDGEPIYELGEFDPKFIRDLTRFTIEQEMKEEKEKAKQEARNAEIKAAQAEINHKWNDNLEKFEAEVPEVRDNIRILTDTFATLEEGYGEYLASTIMNLDSGPQIMNYLSQNIGEARNIVASGPAAATLALGRLDARLTKLPSTGQEEKSNRKVSKAVEPPALQARGHGGKFTVADDTEDLDAFEKKFFNG